MTGLLHDIRFGARMLAKSPGFTLIAVLVLGLGIGGNTAIFTILNAWILHPLAYPHSGRLVRIWETDPTGSQREASPANLRDWTTQNHSFEQLAGFFQTSFNLAGGGRPEVVQGAAVTWNFFDTLGVLPSQGRSFHADQDQPGARNAVIITHELWQNRFAGDPAILGKTILIDAHPATIAGVLPIGFHYPEVGRADVWVPMSLTLKERETRDFHWVNVLARIKPGVALTQAESEMRSIAGRLVQAYPQANAGCGIRMRSLYDEIVEDDRRPLLIVFGAVLGVLLIACANVANLLLARSAGRQKEVAVRLALGAGRGRLVRQLLTETLLLFLAGAALGIVLASWGVGFLSASIPVENRAYVRNFGQASIDPVVLTFTAGIALLTGLLCGLVPAFRGARADLQTTLKAGVNRIAGDGPSRYLRNALVVAEIAVALMLAIGTGLLMKSLANILHTDPGLDPDGVLTLKIDLPAARYEKPFQIVGFYRSVLDAVNRIPGVVAAAASTSVPFSGGNTNYAVFIEGRPKPAPAEIAGAQFRSISPEYFRALRIRVQRGREFTGQDQPDSRPVVIISAGMAKHYWPGENPIGKRIRIDRTDNAWREIAGVVNETKSFFLTEPRVDQVYVPYTQLPETSMGLAIRSEGDPLQIVPAVRNAIAAVDRDQPIAAVRTMQYQIYRKHYGRRLYASLVSVFGALSLILALVGIYGVIAYSVSQRAREIGIRIALGAHAGNINSMVLRQVLALVGMGLSAGLLASLALARVLSNILFGITATDPPTFVSVSLAVAVVAALAGYVPARKAARVDPAIALRWE